VHEIKWIDILLPPISSDSPVVLIVPSHQANLHIAIDYLLLHPWHKSVVSRRILLRQQQQQQQQISTIREWATNTQQYVL